MTSRPWGCSQPRKLWFTDILMYINVHVIMVLTVYGICSVQGLYVLPRAQPEKYIRHKGSTIPCTVKTVKQLTCTDKLYKANNQIRLECLHSSTYCTPSLQRKVLYAIAITL